MSFSDERDMYPLVKRWLEERTKDPCEFVLVDEYTFKYAGNTRRADLLGAYRKNDSWHFVGVEVKSSTSLSDRALRQADSLQSFCHEVYVALPRNDFGWLDETEQDEIATLLQNKKMGLLLVAARGLPEVKHRRITTSFQMDKYCDAVERFEQELVDEKKDLAEGPINQEICDELLELFVRDEKNYDFLEWYWYAEETEEGGRLYWDWGDINIMANEVEFAAYVKELSTVRMFESPLEVTRNIAKALYKLRGRKRWNTTGLDRPPTLVLTIQYEDEYAYDPSFLPFDPKEGRIEIDTSILQNREYVLELASVIHKLDCRGHQVVARLSRKAVFNRGEYDDDEYLEDVSQWFLDLYEVVASIADSFDTDPIGQRSDT